MPTRKYQQMVQTNIHIAHINIHLLFSVCVVIFSIALFSCFFLSETIPKRVCKTPAVQWCMIDDSLYLLRFHLIFHWIGDFSISEFVLATFPVVPEH